MWLIGVDQVAGDLPYELTCGSHIIGRSRSCDLTIRHPTLSREHARIWRNEHGQVTIKDLESKNGTWVGEVRIQQQPLKPPEIFQLGEIRLSLQLTIPESFHEPSEATRSARGRAADAPQNLLIGSLTPAQRQVFDLIVAGCDEQTVAQRLDRSFHTIHVHLKAIFQKLGVHSRADLLALVLRSQQTAPRKQRPDPPARK